MYQRVGVVGVDHRRVAGYRAGVQLLQRQAGRDRADRLGDRASSGDTAVWAATAGPDSTIRS